MFMKDTDGLVTSDATLAVSYTWRVSVLYYRSAEVKNHNFIVSFSSPGGMWSSKEVQ